MNYFAIDKFGIDGGYPTGLTAPGYKAPQGEWINGMLFKKPAPFFYNGDEWNSYLTFGQPSTTSSRPRARRTTG